MPQLLTLSIHRGTVIFSDINSLARSCTSLVQFEAMGCQGAGVSDAGLFHLYITCASLKRIECDSKEIERPATLRGTLLRVKRLKDDQILSYSGPKYCEECFDENDDNLTCLTCESCICIECETREDFERCCSSCGESRYCDDCLMSPKRPYEFNGLVCENCMKLHPVPSSSKRQRT